MVDWIAIRNEYVTGTISCRKLAEKHAVPYPTLRDRAAKEGWTEQRDKHRDKIVAQTEQLSVEKTAEALADEAASKARIRASIIRIAEGWFERQEGYIADGLEIDPADFRRMVQSYRDLCDMDHPVGEDDSGTGVVMIPEVLPVE